MLLLPQLGVSSSPCGLLDEGLCGTSDTLSSHRHWGIPKVRSAWMEPRLSPGRALPALPVSQTCSGFLRGSFASFVIFRFGRAIVLKHGVMGVITAGVWSKHCCFWPGTTLLPLYLTSNETRPFPSFLCLQLVQRINSIYCTKRGKKRLKKLSMSSVETASLRGKGLFAMASSTARTSG